MKRAQYCSFGKKNNVPILKESGPPEVLLTHMAKKSRSAQTVSIFYDSSWVLPRGCPCHSHLKKQTESTPFVQQPTWRGTHTNQSCAAQRGSCRHALHPASCSLSVFLPPCWESASVKLLLSESEAHRRFGLMRGFLFFGLVFVFCVRDGERGTFLISGMELQIKRGF